MDGVDCASFTYVVESKIYKRVALDSRTDGPHRTIVIMVMHPNRVVDFQIQKHHRDWTE